MKITEELYYIPKDYYDVFVIRFFLFSFTFVLTVVQVSWIRNITMCWALGLGEVGRSARYVTSIHARTILFINRPNAIGPCISSPLPWLQHRGITAVKIP